MEIRILFVLDHLVDDNQRESNLYNCCCVELGTYNNTWCSIWTIPNILNQVRGMIYRTCYYLYI